MTDRWEPGALPEEEARLVERAKHGDRDAFGSLVEPWRKPLFGYIYRMVTLRQDAEDLLQDVLTKLFERSAELSSIRDLAPYLSRVLYNQFVDDRRRYRRRALAVVDGKGVTGDIAGDADPVADAERSERDARLARAVARLSEDHRIVLLLADAEGHTLPEIEAMTEIPLGTLKSRLHRARARLRGLLEIDGTFSATSTCSSVEGARRDAL